MGSRITIDQLEKMTTHELADLLANIVLLLRRMPDAICQNLIQQVPKGEDRERPKTEIVAMAVSSLTKEELFKRKLPELKVLAKTLNVLYTSKMNKEDIIQKILAKPLNGLSEQRAIQDL